MATYVNKAATLWVGGYDLTADFGAHSLSMTQTAVDNTAYAAAGTKSRTYLPGLYAFNYDHQGFIDPDGSTGPDDVLWTNYTAAASEVICVAPDSSNTQGDVVYFAERVHTAIEPLTGSVGDVAGFALSATGTGETVRGVVEYPPTSTSTDTSSTGQQLGSVAAGENIYAALFVTVDSGSDLAVTLESDDNSGFTTATTRGTFTTTSGIGAEMISVAGAITDDWWRFTWTRTGTFTFAAVFGIR